MISKEWVDIKIFDKVEQEYEIYDQQKFEKLVEDKFKAVEIGDDNIYWWTTKYVCCVLDLHSWSELLIILPRNYEEK